MNFPRPTWRSLGLSFLPASGNQTGALPFLSRAPPPDVGPEAGLLVPLAFPIPHTSTLCIFGSQEESRVGTGVSTLDSSLVFDFTWWEGRT